MRFTNFKPLHGWREFIHEIVIVINEEKSLSVHFLSRKLALVDRFYAFSGQRGPKSG